MSSPTPSIPPSQSPTPQKSHSLQLVDDLDELKGGSCFQCRVMGAASMVVIGSMLLYRMTKVRKPSERMYHAGFAAACYGVGLWRWFA